MATEIEGRRKSPAHVVEAVGQPLADLTEEKIVIADGSARRGRGACGRTACRKRTWPRRRNRALNSSRHRLLRRRASSGERSATAIWRADGKAANGAVAVVVVRGAAEGRPSGRPCRPAAPRSAGAAAVPRLRRDDDDAAGAVRPLLADAQVHRPADVFDLRDSFDFEVGGEALCGPCAQHRPRYSRARAALVYDEASRPLMLAFKNCRPHRRGARLRPLDDEGRRRRSRRSGRPRSGAAALDPAVRPPIQSGGPARPSDRRGSATCRCCLTRSSGPDGRTKMRTMGRSARARNVAGVFAVRSAARPRLAGRSRRPRRQCA